MPEFSHAIMHALRRVEPKLYREIQTAYRGARAEGRFAGHYAETTADEYWAEGTQWWFGSNYAWRDGERWLRDADDLKAYDATLYGLLARVYADQHIPADVYHGHNAK